MGFIKEVSSFGFYEGGKLVWVSRFARLARLDYVARLARSSHLANLLMKEVSERAQGPQMLPKIISAKQS